eukprot:6482565-Amphidinium_carterae.2
MRLTVFEQCPQCNSASSNLMRHAPSSFSSIRMPSVLGTSPDGAGATSWACDLFYSARSADVFAGATLAHTVTQQPRTTRWRRAMRPLLLSTECMRNSGTTSARTHSYTATAHLLG